MSEAPLRIVVVDDEPLAGERLRRMLGQMPGEDGFALLGSLRPKPAVIFVTAFDHYAVRAFEEQAQDYLMKPFRQERLAEALERVHRSAIANLDFAESLRPAFAGTYRLLLRDAARSEIPVSRQRARLLRERLGA